MLRAMDSYYEGKRNFDLIKVKDFADAEYKVVDVETGTKKMLVNGIMKETPCVTALIIEHKGSKVGVGSGLSDDQRVEWFKKPDKIIGSEITVNYFEETIDSKTGLPSLRFPTLKTVYDKKLGRQI
ncbi:hypothetical protein FACS1894166_10020 [Bacilli bacterium]|nr:hypothetical protein FACS1894166_10020 [Bacilli bacterium]